MDKTIIRAKVIPQAKHNQIENLEIDDRGDLFINIRVIQPAVDNAANDAVIKLLASILKIRKSAIYIVKGEKSRSKIIEVQGLTTNETTKRLQVCQQGKLTFFTISQN
ncbi:conserved hypothetical protein [Alphaproteobacteria bacterium]